jgi:hypothetical protein
MDEGFSRLQTLNGYKRHGSIGMRLTQRKLAKGRLVIEGAFDSDLRLRYQRSQVREISVLKSRGTAMVKYRYQRRPIDPGKDLCVIGQSLGTCYSSAMMLWPRTLTPLQFNLISLIRSYTGLGHN